MASQEKAAPLRCVLLLSGGIDSVSLIPLLKREGMQVYPVFCDYGQASLKQEQAAAVKCANALQTMPLKLVNLDLWNLERYSLLRAPSSRSDLSNYFLPFRNIALSVVGAAHAVEVGARAVALGFNTDCAFSDTGIDFIDKMDAVLELSAPASSSIRLWRGATSLSKAELIEAAIEDGAPLEDTYSCYKAHRCLICPSCKAVSDAFASLEGRVDATELLRRNPNHMPVDVSR